MGKTKLTASKLRQLAKTFQSEGITSDGYILRCEWCDSTIHVDENHQQGRVKQHISTPKHEAASNHQKRTHQQFVSTALHAQSSKAASTSEFHLDLTAALLQSGVPLYKIHYPAMRNFLEKYTKHSIPDESTLRKNYIKPVYETTISKVREKVGENPVAFIVDEATDTKKRFVLNVLVMPLTGEVEKAMLLKMYNLEAVNGGTVMQSFNDACCFLWPDGIKYDHVWLVLTDQASYMLSAFRMIKLMFPNLNHITCIAHALHRVCESVRSKYATANRFVSEMKKVLLKSPFRTQLYRETTDLPLPPDPVVTRWGTWVNAAVFYAENFNAIKEFLYRLDAEDAQAIDAAQKLSQDETVRQQLLEVYDLKNVVHAIKKLEAQGITVQEQWNILQEVQSQLPGFAKAKLEASLAKNPDILKIVENFKTVENLEFCIKAKYAPLTSVDVERSFSVCKNTLSTNRESFTFCNLEMINVTRINSFLFMNQ